MNSCHIHMKKTRRDKRTGHWRDRERVCVREGRQLQTEVAQAVKMAVEETDHLG